METTNQKKWKEIVLPNTGRRKKKNWFDLTYVAYTTTFVYSKYHGNFIIRGYANDVVDYLKENHTHYFYNMVLLHKGKMRNIWMFWHNNWTLFESMVVYKGSFWSDTKKIIKREPFRLTKIGGDKRYTFKRMPKRWIPLMDKCK